MRTDPYIAEWVATAAVFVLLWPLFAIDACRGWSRRENNKCVAAWWRARPRWMTFR